MRTKGVNRIVYLVTYLRKEETFLGQLVKEFEVESYALTQGATYKYMKILIFCYLFLFPLGTEHFLIDSFYTD